MGPYACVPHGICSLVLFAALLFVQLQRGFAAKMIDLQILDGLLRKDYDRRATPTNHLNNATTVYCELYIRSMGSINPSTMDYEVDLYLRQKWQDERLRHPELTEPLDLNDPNLVKAIWKPEVYFPNAKHGEFQYVTVPNVLVRINPDGEILYMLRLKLTFSCMMDLSKFPLDSQMCTMELASFSKTIEELRLEWKNEKPIITYDKLRMPQYEIKKITVSDCQESFQIGNYSCLVAEFHMRRSMGFHLVQSYLPTFLIVIISWVSFWMDVNSVPARTTLGVTTLLTVSTQAAGVQGGLPQVSYVKAIDVWMGTCTAFVFCALLEFTFVNYMWRKQVEPESRLRCPQAVIRGASASTAGHDSSGQRGTYVKSHTPDDIMASGKLLNQPSEVICTNCGNGNSGSRLSLKKSPEDSPTSGDPTTTAKLLIEYKKKARKIDEISRLGFPMAFIMFNIFYWSYYLLL